jgi:hypothetical protein
MDSNDPEERIRELERRLADPAGGPRENVLGRYEVRPTQAPGMFPPPPNPGWLPPPIQGVMPPPSPGAIPSSYDLLRYQGGRPRRFGSAWLVLLVPAILFLIGVAYHLYRVATPSAPWPDTSSSANPSNALTVGPGGNLTVGPSSQTLTLVCNHGNLTVDGNTGQVNVTGHCARLTVKGSHNKVNADTADTIDTEGSDNQVVYHTGAPEITVGGSANTVNRG